MYRIAAFCFAFFLAMGAFAATGGSLGFAQDENDNDNDADVEVEVTLRDQDDEEVGTATFREADGEVTITVEVEDALEAGLEPGERGIHIHETGICDPEDDPPFDSAGEHFNPTGAPHGGPDDPEDEAHAGDLGNITIDEDGSGTLELTTDRFTLEEGDHPLRDEDGAALLIHEREDDLETDPDGDSGDPLVCGVIYPPEDEDENDVAEAVTVEAVDIDFNPNEFTIEADTDVPVTITNTGETEHTFTIDELDIDVVLGPGEEEEITINAEAGEYTYYCTVPGHREAGQEGTMTVE